MAKRPVAEPHVGPEEFESPLRFTARLEPLVIAILSGIVLSTIRD